MISQPNNMRMAASSCFTSGAEWVSPTMACLGVGSVLPEDAALIIRSARETRSSNVRVPPPANLERGLAALLTRLLM